MKPLVDLTSRALARMIEGKSPEEIRATFNLPDDLSAEEKLEPIMQDSHDPRIKLLNRLYAKKRQASSIVLLLSGGPSSQSPWHH
jgi:S-phase kinase-associated protein 1